MTLFSVLGLISTIAMSLPIVLLLVLRLSFYKSFPALLFYYLFIFSYNFLNLGYIKVDRDITFYHGTLSNLLDAPLILLFLTYFSRTALFRKKLVIATVAFVAFEIVVLIIYGFTIKATTVILAPGLLTVLALSIIFFIHQVKIAVVYHKAFGKAIMIASILFAYAGYSFVYAVYYLIETPYKSDANIIFYLITILTSLSMAIGIYAEQKRVKQLAELQTTREELKAIYGEEETKTATPPIEATIFKFDNEQLN